MDEADDELEEMRRRDREQRWQRICPARFAHAHVDDLTGELADTVAKWRVEPWRNLVLLGNVGVGKTHAAVAAARLANSAGWDVRCHDVVALLQSLRPGGDGEEPYQRAMACDVLVLDDLGVERASDWTAERLYALVNQRWLDRRATVATSNCDPGVLAEAVGPRTYDRLIDDAVVVVATGESRRGPHGR